MEITSQKSGAVDIFEIKGRMDIAGAEIAEKYFQQMVQDEQTQKNCQIVFDLGGVDYVSSSGLRLFVKIFKHVEEAGGKLVLCGMNIAVEEVFQFAGLDAVFKIFPIRDEAVRFFAS
ncbi:MAG TPA: STAS domain-containing protein [Candidatus Sumerlaeota bacterium]|nr:MAG: putative anti-sigma factor antagonist BtrV [candidate division BRC1 bacterium ADurb.Bin183]HOE64394.1 STAS domain-containing protein [Candidatus Sumerlaeota bacterium]HRR31812.1 STAS domain-containing protein [Candidatus Sumerlaeia bacterium]HON51149.1 STAS domain-containing protein [Candidatus Sumerlaeota bacterium]HOR64972.1 STAS domain-containing protein [Candidatus Sumerlaeota bacterium]